MKTGRIFIHLSPTYYLFSRVSHFLIFDFACFQKAMPQEKLLRVPGCKYLLQQLCLNMSVRKPRDVYKGSSFSHEFSIRITIFCSAAFCYRRSSLKFCPFLHICPVFFEPCSRFRLSRSGCSTDRKKDQHYSLFSRWLRGPKMLDVPVGMKRRLAKTAAVAVQHFQVATENIECRTKATVLGRTFLFVTNTFWQPRLKLLKGLEIHLHQVLGRHLG